MQTKLSPNGITAVLFDLDGTLRHSRPPFNQTLLDYAVQLGAPDSPEQRRNVLRWVHAYWAQSPEMLQDQATYGGLSDEFWSYYTCLTLLQLRLPGSAGTRPGTASKPAHAGRIPACRIIFRRMPGRRWSRCARPASPWGWSPTGAIPTPNNWQPWD